MSDGAHAKCSGEECDCDYWHSEHRWHCATNYPAGGAR